MPKVVKTGLGKVLQKRGAKAGQNRKTFLWKGPETDGITQSLLSRFIVCRERFRLYALEGLSEAEGFNKHLEYGNMWHVCEEATAGNNDWREPLREYAASLCRRYPLQQHDIDKWFNVCRYQYPIYLEYWKGHSDVLEREPICQEQVFHVPYKLPSGRIVTLRGKWDSVDVIGKGKKAQVYLQENKTKGDINEQQLLRQLSSGFDLQTMLYIVAWEESPDSGYVSEGHMASDVPPYPTGGVRYNVIRRPLSGGKGTIKQKEPNKTNPRGETAEEYYARLAQYIVDEPGYFFMRWKVDIDQTAIERFKKDFLNPCLEQLCDWWQVMNGGQVSPYASDYQHYRLPFGVYNPIIDGGSSDLDEYLQTGSEVGLTRVETLFPELV